MIDVQWCAMMFNDVHTMMCNDHIFQIHVFSSQSRIFAFRNLPLSEAGKEFSGEVARLPLSTWSDTFTYKHKCLYLSRASVKITENKSIGEDKQQQEGHEDVWSSLEDLLNDNDHNATKAWHLHLGLAPGIRWLRCPRPWTSWQLCQHPPLLKDLPSAKEEL